MPKKTIRTRTPEMKKLASRVISCTLCPRLVEYRQQVGESAPRRFRGDEYWSKPLPGFGDPAAKLLVLGLAPAAHGGNRTGRVFTGDATARFLMRGLFDAGFASQPTSDRTNDGLALRDAYLTAAVKCAPPANRPSGEELSNCLPYLFEEFRLMPSARAILTLGRLAFDAYRRYLEEEKRIDTGSLVFRHGALFRFGDKAPGMYVSYHPSPRNTQTGLLTMRMFSDILDRIKEDLAGG